MKPDALPLPHLLWLLGGLLLAAAPHTLRLPWWVSVTAAALFLWRAYVARRRTALPARWLLLTLALGSVIGVYATYRTIFGRDAGVTLLVVLLAVKPAATYSSSCSSPTSSRSRISSTRKPFPPRS